MTDPEELASLVAENERLRAELAEARDVRGAVQAEWADACTEHERVKSERDSFRTAYATQCGHTLVAKQEADALRTQLAEAQKDAQRYRWLREQHEGHEPLSLDADGLPMPLMPTALAFTVFQPDRGSLEPVGCIPGELDAAIDAALSQEQTRQHGSASPAAAQGGQPGDAA